MKSLDATKSEEFKEALTFLIGNSIDLGSAMRASLAGKEYDPFASLQDLKGMNADQIITHANQVMKEREEKMREQALKEIAELEASKIKAEEAQVELEKFKVLKSRFYKYKKEHSFTAKPIIELKVKNETTYPISRIYCQGVLASPGRAIPWLQEEFNYQIAGGLEPGEIGDWSLAPNSFSTWGKVDAPKDAVLTVTITRLDGPDEKELFSSDFSESKRKRLEELKAKYQSQN